jgi:hypothetical protein
LFDGSKSPDALFFDKRLYAGFSFDRTALRVASILLAFAVFRFELGIPARFCLGVEELLAIIVLCSLGVGFDRASCVLVCLDLRDLSGTGNRVQIG